MRIPENFTITPNSQKGDVYGTTFTCTCVLPPVYTTFTWSFGDGVQEYNKRTATHEYKYPGIYSISLSAWTETGDLHTDYATVDVDYAIRDVILFSNVPNSYGVPGRPSNTPFTVSLTSSKIDQDLSVVFQAFNAKSVPHYSVPDKWRFITPKWKFVDASTNKILDGPLPISSVPIYKNSKIIAVSGEASFYYIDDLSTGEDSGDAPLLLAATLSTERFSYPPESLNYPYASYSNSEVARAMIAWQIEATTPTKLKVTENYLNDVYPVKWTNVPMPVMITCETEINQSSNPLSSTIYSTIDLSYPKTNEIGANSPVVLSLSSDVYGEELQNGIHYSVTPHLSFRAFDENKNVSSGYVFTTIIPLSTITGNLVVKAATVTSSEYGGGTTFGYPYGYPIRRDVYVSHPSKGVINKIDVVFSNETSNVEYYQQLGSLIEGSLTYFSVPVLTSTNLVNYSLSGTGAVYAIAVNPIKNRLYFCDAEQNTLVMYSEGSLLSSLQLSSIFNSEILAPFHISIDEHHNVWLSLFDDRRLAKFDSDLNYLLSAAPAFDGSGFMSINSSNEANLVSPPLIETDMDSNVWACYTNPVSSLLVKFDPSGHEIYKAAEFPGNSMPVCLAIDAYNGVWVACKNTNCIMKYDTLGTLVETVTGFLKPSYIAIDRSNNVWVAHGYNLCSVYNVTERRTETWKVSTKPQQIISLPSITQTDIDYSIYKEEIWGGLTTDVQNRMWAIDSDNNVAICFKPKNPTIFKMNEILPVADTEYILKPGDNFVTNFPSNKVRSAQASGDWTGNKWYQKYTKTYSGSYIEGVSTQFKLYDIDSFQISKVNENFDCASYYKSLALPEILARNTSLFDEFFVAAVGNGDVSEESLGRVVYERIANFISNKGDLETVDVKSLLSIAESIAVDAKTYGIDFPAGIARLLDIFSVSKQRLRGLINLDEDLENNIGPLLTETSLITADRYYFLKDKKYGKYQILFANELNGGSLLYPIDQLLIEGLRTPISENYYVFEYNEQTPNGYTGNIIDWTSKYTTIPYNLSSYEEWYGDGGLVETMFNNLLTKQLLLQ